MTQENRRGLLIILSSPSGAGKSTLARRLRQWDPEIEFSISATTRAPRAGEVDGQDYMFTKPGCWERRIRSDVMMFFKSCSVSSRSSLTKT